MPVEEPHASERWPPTPGGYPENRNRRLAATRHRKLMKIRNTDTNGIEEIRYEINGCDTLADLTEGDTELARPTEEDAESGIDRQASGDTIAWWRDHIKIMEERDAVREASKEELGMEIIEEALGQIDCEFNDRATLEMSAIIDAMTEHGYRLKTYDDGSIGFVEDVGDWLVVRQIGAGQSYTVCEEGLSEEMALEIVESMGKNAVQGHTVAIPGSRRAEFLSDAIRAQSAGFMSPTEIAAAKQEGRK